MSDRKRKSDLTERGTQTVPVSGVEFQSTTLDSAVENVLRLAKAGGCCPIRFANAYSVALSAKDDEYAAVLNGIGLNYPDGLPVVWFMRARRHRGTLKPRRVRGPSLFEAVLDRGRKYDVSHFFLGTTDETLDALVQRKSEQMIGITIAGTYSPPFTSATGMNLEDMCRRIQEVRPDIVWVALGTPKQDFVARELSIRLELPCLAVGAAFDFSAGTVRTAPIWMQSSGLEWVYRLIKDPKRLWRRYFFGNFTFLRVAVSGLVRSYR